MATSTYLSNSKVEIGSSSVSVTDITDQVSACTVNFIVEALENVFASFDNMGTAPQQSLTPIVKQLLGIDRPAVA